MDDEVLMSILDRAANDQEEIQPLADAQAMRRGVLGDRTAFNVLHHQVGLPFVGRPAVENGGDVGVLQARQYLALLAEATLDELRSVSPTDQLQRDRLLERVVVAYRPVHGAHAPARDHGEDAVGTDAAATEAPSLASAPGSV